MESATKKVGETKIRAIGLSDQGKTGVGYQFKQLHKTTLARSIVGRRKELNLNIKKPEYMTGSLVLQTDFS